MKYTIKSKPTVYGGIRFRSRLEAEWASFFDEMKWRWEYEPFDVEGWCPDFILKGSEFDVLVEVKPITNLFKIKNLDKYRHHWFIPAILGVGPEIIKDGYYDDTDYLRIGWVNNGLDGWDDLVLKDNFDISNANGAVVNLLFSNGCWQNFASNETIAGCMAKWGKAKGKTTFLKF